MTQSELQPASLPQLLSPATRLGHVQLTVADLERELAFYQHVLGSVNAIISLWYISYGGKGVLALTRLECGLPFRTGGKLMQRAIAITAFLAAVTCVEAFTLALITGVTTHWHSSIIGAESKQEA